MKKWITVAATVVLTTAFLAGCGSSSQTSDDSSAAPEKIEITNVSYDPTREFYEAYNTLFQEYWQEEAGQEVEITQSHGGSGKQARSVIEGNEADVVTLALAQDITAIEEAGMINEGWIDEFADNSAPYTSTIVFLVRKGNEKNIQDWDDLIKEGVEVITPNPKTSGGARWNYLAAWAFAQASDGNDEEQTKEFMKKLYDNVTVLDSGARGATTTFVENGQGDVLIAWENEAYLSVKENPDEYEIITPSISILAEPSVAVVDEVAEKNGTEEVATAYLEYLYSDEAQRLAGDNYYRPSNATILEEYADVFDLNVEMVTIADFGGWEEATQKHFDDGATFDSIYEE
ncbi:MAG: sulfate ABC transporter substrate-binding protein [Lachnospiraceae bacterium]